MTDSEESDETTGDYKAKLATLPTAVYYDCRDNENLTHEDPIEAVLELLDLHYDGRPVDAQVRALGDVHVKAYARSTVSDAWFARMTDDVVERVSESFDEEYVGFEADDSCTDKVARWRRRRTRSRPRSVACSRTSTRGSATSSERRG